MDESNAFTKKHVEEVTAAQRTLLDELNLPPAVKNYIRDNARFLQVSFVLIVALICAWNYYNYYTTNKKDAAAQQLAQALVQTDALEKTEALERIASEYTSTGSGIWSSLTLARDNIANSHYDEAIGQLKPLLVEVNSASPLYPLVNQLMASAYEHAGNLEQALAFYDTLSTIPGFAALGYMESGRVYELQGQMAKAKEVYEKASSSEGLNQNQRAWLQDRLNSLQAS